VPRAIERGNPLPVVIVAHGKNRLPEHALRTLVGEPPDDTMTLSYAAHHLPRMPEQGALLVAPWGYGDAGVQPVAEHDLLRVLDELGASYPVDESRVSLTGYSMGGTLSFVAPLHHPDRFAAAAPLCGYPNLLDYRSVASVERRPWERALLEKKYIVRYADNGLHLPLHVIHGGLDVPGRSKVVVDRYRELGQSVIFDVPKEAEHDVWTDGYEDGRMVHWLTRKKRPTAPERVRFVSGEYRYDRAWWVRIAAFDDASRPEPARVDASWKPTESELAIELVGVQVLELDLAQLEPAPAGPVTITIGETKLTATPEARVYLVKEAGKYTTSEREPTRDGHKRHGQSGPLDDLQFTPVTIVVGTQDPALTSAYRLVAEHLGSLGGTADLRYPIVDDVDANDAELEGRSVVLLGTPEQNLLTRAVASLLPARFERGALSIGGSRHEGDDVTVSFIAPRPLGFRGERARQRHASGYVVVHAAASARAALAVRMLPRFLPDWVVYDASLAKQKGGLLFDQRPVRAAGFFSERWD
jgi:pimeloyl-ACP methyl ester carboxylesterase